MVTGGYGTKTYTRLVSTEILVTGSDAWVLVGDLPTPPIDGLRGVSFNNKIIMTGNNSLILSFSKLERKSYSVNSSAPKNFFSRKYINLINTIFFKGDFVNNLGAAPQN